MSLIQLFLEINLIASSQSKKTQCFIVIYSFCSGEMSPRDVYGVHNSKVICQTIMKPREVDGFSYTIPYKKIDCENVVSCLIFYSVLLISSVTTILHVLLIDLSKK